MLFVIGAYHLFACHKVEEVVENTVEAVEETTEEPVAEEPEAELEIEEETETSSKTKKSAKGKYGDVKNPTDKITNVTHKNTEEAKVEVTGGEEPAEITIVDNSKEEADTENAIREAEENGDTIKELDNGIIAIEKNEETKEDESKKDLEKVDIEDEKAEAIEVPSTTEEEKVEDVKDDNACIEDTTDEDLDEMLNSTTKEEESANGKTEITDLELPKTEVQEEVKPVEKEEPKIEEVKPVEPVKTVNPVSVSAIDGYTTTVGSQIQFRVNGDDVKVEGLDGINYSFNNGVLTVDAGSEATVLSVCVSNSVNAVNFDIVVNGVLQ